jgi:hypothetical protein
MSEKKMSLTYEQLAYICEQTGERNPKTAVEAFAAIMKKEGIRPRFLPEVVTKLMERERKRLK